MTYDIPKQVAQQRRVTDNLQQLLAILPPPLQAVLTDHPRQGELIEIVMDLGRLPEARFPGSAEYVLDTPVQRSDLDYSIARVGEFSGDNRAGIESTLHRISAMRNRQGVVIGLTCRVGRSVIGTIGMIQDLVEQGKSILLLGRPGVGKTTALREIARVLADDFLKRVVIIDTSNEIAGDGDIPHPAIGRARRMQVATPAAQHNVMIEAVENHMPEVIVIDEIGTELEALAARTIAERGVQLVGTAHGNQLENLIKNPTLADLIGGIQSVTLGDEEARRRGSQKSVLERKALPTFDIAVEMLARDRWVVHENVSETIDNLLRNWEVRAQERSISETGAVNTQTIAYGRPDTRRTTWRDNQDRANWRQSGTMAALPLPNWLDESPSESSNGGGGGLAIYPYAVSRYHLEQAIATLNFNVRVSKDIDDADVVLALRSQVRSRSKIQQLAEARQVPIHIVKSNTLPHITRALRRILQIDEPPYDADLDAFMHGDSEDEMEALEEARLAVEQIVLPKNQPVELLPRSAAIRRMQHELVEHYQLNSESFGDEPNRRLRIYPA